MKAKICLLGGLACIVLGAYDVYVSSAFGSFILGTIGGANLLAWFTDNFFIVTSKTKSTSCGQTGEVRKE